MSFGRLSNQTALTCSQKNRNDKTKVHSAQSALFLSAVEVMTATLKTRLSIGALVIAGLAFLDGMSVLCYCPGSFVFAVPFAIAAIFLGTRWSVRVIGISLCVASIAMGVRQSERKRHVEAIMKAVRDKAATNSISK
jgi:MFS-type transporter involved in bile tolerance (Atg22 family)